MKWFGLREIIPCLDGHCKDGRCGVSETTIVKVPSDAIENAIALCESVLDPCREVYGDKIRVTSGYRCRRKNAALAGSSSTSQHCLGEAADLQAILAPGSTDREQREANLRIAKAIVKNGNYDQLLIEGCSRFGLDPKWVHVSWRKFGPNRHQILRQVPGVGFLKLRPNEMALLTSE